MRPHGFRRRALLMDASHPRELAGDVKAILMATALHNIEGSSRLSERTGGGLTCGRLFTQRTRLVERPYGLSRRICRCNTVSMRLPARRSGGIAWDSNPNNTYTTDPLEADLDLRLRNPAALLWLIKQLNQQLRGHEYTAAETGNTPWKRMCELVRVQLHVPRRAWWR